MAVLTELVPVSPDDSAAVQGYVDVVNAVRRADSPWEPPLTHDEVVGRLRYGWDLEPGSMHLLHEGGRVVAAGGYSTSERDNLHLAWADVEVHPEHRRRGHGTAVLAALLDRARADGRTSLGIGGWDSASTRGFAQRHGLELRAVEVNRRQLLAELDRSALERACDEARPHAADYDLERRLGRSPDEELEALAEMTAAINDAPTDDLDVEDEVYDAARVRAYETAQLGRGLLLHRVLARHRATGELAGQTVVVVDGERPWLAEQHDTSVVAAHRGHRLGLLLKAEMLRWLAQTQPQLVSIDTWNAESNDHMIGVNELMGYRVMGRGLVFQRSV